jgi:hypothetical protein
MFPTLRECQLMDIDSIGDVVDALMALMVVRTCQQVEGGLPASVKTKMMFNIVLDFGIGLVPFVGDLVDALFRANTRNAIVLEEYLRDQGAKKLKAQGRVVPVDPTDPDVYDEIVAGQTTPPRIESNHSPRNATKTGTGSSSRDDRDGWLNNNRIEDVERGERREPLLPAQAHLTDEPRCSKSNRLQKSSR